MKNIVFDNIICKWLFSSTGTLSCPHKSEEQVKYMQEGHNKWRALYDQAKSISSTLGRRLSRKSVNKLNTPYSQSCTNNPCNFAYKNISTESYFRH